MGGVAGHMDHLYDNPSLTFSKMIEIMEAASSGELTTEEIATLPTGPDPAVFSA